VLDLVETGCQLRQLLLQLVPVCLLLLVKFTNGDFKRIEALNDGIDPLDGGKVWGRCRDRDRDGAGSWQWEMFDGGSRLRCTA